VWSKIMAAQRGIESGKIHVPDTTTASAAKKEVNG
jgi:hypothetical protein